MIIMLTSIVTITPMMACIVVFRGGPCLKMNRFTCLYIPFSKYVWYVQGRYQKNAPVYRCHRHLTEMALL